MCLATCRMNLARFGATILAALLLTGLVAAPVSAQSVAYKATTPFGLWEVPYDKLAEVRYHEHDVIVKSFEPSMNIVRYLDAVGAQGKKAVVSFNNVVDYKNGLVYPSRIKFWTDQIKNHPALYGYLSAKEPNWNRINLTELRSLYKEFKRQDPNHRVIVLLGDVPHFGTSANPWGAGVANMLWVDWYPVTCKYGMLTTASTHFPKVRGYVNKVTPGVPIWLMVQGHTYYRGDRCTPTNAQLDRQVRDGFRYLKANGILFQTWHNPLYDKDLRRNATLTRHMREVMRGVEALTF